jgi:hypothetical protein
MPLLSKPSPHAHAALIYVTVGALMMVWTAVWFVYIQNYPPVTDLPFYLLTDFGITGLVLFIIGLSVGQIGRAARQAELPPPEAMRAEQQIQQTAASRPDVVAR